MYTLPYLSEQTIQMLRLWKIIGMHVPLRGRWLPFVSVDQEIWFSDSEGKKTTKTTIATWKISKYDSQRDKTSKTTDIAFFLPLKWKITQKFSLLFFIHFCKWFEKSSLYFVVYYDIYSTLWLKMPHMCSFCSSFLSYVKGRDLCRLFGSLKKPILPPNTSQLQFSINK